MASGIRWESDFYDLKLTKLSNESRNDQNAYEDIIKLVDNIRLGKAEINQQLAVISRCRSLVRKIKEESDEHVLTELAFVLQACRGKIKVGQMTLFN